MSNEVKHRKKGGSPAAKEAKDAQRTGAASGQRPQEDNAAKVVTASPDSGSGSLCPDFRTVLCFLCLAVCVALTWIVFQQSQNFSLLEQKYHSLHSRSSSLGELEAKVGDIFVKLKEASQVVAKLKQFDVHQRIEQLQNDIANMEQWTDGIAGKRGHLEGNLTSLGAAISQIEQSTAAIAKDVSTKIATVKTDVRRVSGMEEDVVLLTNSVKELEEKLEKVEKNTAQTIGDAVAHSIDRIATLKSSVSTNSNRIDHLKQRLQELRANFTKNSDKLSGLESDRQKVLQAVNFANELKPKVHTLRKDFTRSDELLSDLSLRIGRLAADLLNREKDITVLSEKMHNLTVIKSEILSLDNQISNMQPLKDTRGDM